MASTKTARTLQASGTVTANTPLVATELDLSTKYGGVLTVKVTNTGTTTSPACNTYVYVGHATTVKKLFAILPGVTTSSAVTEYAIEIPPSVMFLNVTFQDNASQNVTAEAFLQELTTV